jgi:ATP-dependent RNA helicase RhlE
MLQRLAPSRPPPRKPRVLVLTPTRELAAQVEESVRTYGKHLPLKTRWLIFGGVGINPQIEALKRAASTSSSPRRAACSTTSAAHRRPVGHRDPRARRSRPHARHGLHPRHPQVLALLPKQRQTCSSRPPSPTRSASWPTACCTTRPLVEVARAQHHRRTVASASPVDREKKRELLII